MRISYDAGVHEDLDEIEAYIAQDNVERAISFSNELIAAAESLVDFPYKGNPISKQFGNAYRKYHYKGYTIYYKVDEAEIRILEIFQQSKEIHRLKPV